MLPGTPEKGDQGRINLCGSGTGKRGGRCSELGGTGRKPGVLLLLELLSVSVQDVTFTPDGCWH